MLNGRWFPAEDAADVTPADLYGNTASHEELGCLDHEGFPRGTGEMNLSKPPCGCAIQWVSTSGSRSSPGGGENGSYVENPDGLSDFSSFEDRYRDCWPSFSDYLVEEIELLQEGWPEEAICYFDEDTYEYARLDYTVLDAPQGEVYVFKDL